MISGAEPSEELSEASIEHPRHISSKEKITLLERPTPGLPKAHELLDQSLQGKQDFFELMDLQAGVDQMISEKGVSEKVGFSTLLMNVIGRT